MPETGIVHHYYNHRGVKLPEIRGHAPTANASVEVQIAGHTEFICVFAADPDSAYDLALEALLFDDCRRAGEICDDEITFTPEGVHSAAFIIKPNSTEFEELDTVAEAWYGIACGRCPDVEPWPPTPESEAEIEAALNAS